MAEIRFTVYGRAQQKGSKRALPVRSKAGPTRAVLVESNKRAAPWAAEVKSAALRAICGPGYGDPIVELFRGPVRVEMAFWFARPRSHYGTGRNAGTVRAGAPAHMITMPDIDKLARCAVDALTGVVFHDDAQVSELFLQKRYGEPESLVVKVVEL